MKNSKSTKRKSILSLSLETHSEAELQQDARGRKTQGASNIVSFN